MTVKLGDKVRLVTALTRANLYGDHADDPDEVVLVAETVLTVDYVGTGYVHAVYTDEFEGCVIDLNLWPEDYQPVETVSRAAAVTLYRALFNFQYVAHRDDFQKIWGERLGHMFWGDYVESGYDISKLFLRLDRSRVNELVDYLLNEAGLSGEADGKANS